MARPSQVSRRDRYLKSDLRYPNTYSSVQEGEGYVQEPFGAPAIDSPPRTLYISPIMPKLLPLTSLSPPAGVRTSNPYEGRWRWWYPALVEWMILNPGKPVKDSVKKNGGPIDAAAITVQMIANTDVFRAHLAQRRAGMREAVDMKVFDLSTRLIDKSSELLLERMDKKRDGVKTLELVQVLSTSLESLGYGPKGATTNVQVNTAVDARSATVSGSVLEAARNAARAAQGRALPPEPAIEDRSVKTAFAREHSRPPAPVQDALIDELMEETSYGDAGPEEEDPESNGGVQVGNSSQRKSNGTHRDEP